VEFYTDNNRQAYECIHERDEYIDYLESKLSNTRPQQALPVVPKFVAVQIERVKNSNGNFATLGLFDSNYDKKPDYAKWIEDNINEFMVACSVGYTVEKSQLFYLKAKELLVVGDYDHVEDLWLDWNKNFTPKKQDAHQFTQEEIDDMDSERYDQVEVTE
jgi:hypothetical protein